jgi:hypothetical protein
MIRRNASSPLPVTLESRGLAALVVSALAENRGSAFMPKR